MSDCTCGNVDGRAVRNETCPVHGVYPCKPKSPDSGARECDRLRLENKQLKARLDEAALILKNRDGELDRTLSEVEQLKERIDRLEERDNARSDLMED